MVRKCGQEACPKLSFSFAFLTLFLMYESGRG